MVEEAGTTAMVWIPFKYSIPDRFVEGSVVVAVAVVGVVADVDVADAVVDVVGDSVAAAIVCIDVGDGSGGDVAVVEVLGTQKASAWAAA